MTETPAVFVTVSVYVVVAVGVTVTALPLVTAPTPPLTLPVPLLNTGVSVVEVPAVIVAAAEVKLLIAGAGKTVIVSPVLVPTIPWESVTRIVNVWLAPAVVGVPCTMTEFVELLERVNPAGAATIAQV